MSPLHMIRAQVRSVENTDIMRRNATALSNMVGEEVEIHPGKEKAPMKDMVRFGCRELERILEIILALPSRAQKGKLDQGRTGVRSVLEFRSPDSLGYWSSARNSLTCVWKG